MVEDYGAGQEEHGMMASNRPCQESTRGRCYRSREMVVRNGKVASAAKSMILLQFSSKKDPKAEPGNKPGPLS